MSRTSPAGATAKTLATFRDRLQQLHHVPAALRIVWQAAPGWTALSLAILLIQGILPVIAVYITRDLINALVAFTNQDPGALRHALLTMTTVGGLALGTILLAQGSAYIRTVLAELVRDRMHDLIQAKAISLDMQFFESPTYYDQLQRASVDAIDRPLALLDSISGLLQSLITLVAMSGVLLTFNWWLPVIILVGSLPAFWVTVRHILVFNAWRRRNTVHERRLRYYQQTLIQDQAAAEVRLFDLGEHFSRAYTTLRGQIRRERLDLARRLLVGQNLAGSVAVVSIALAMVWQIAQSPAGQYTVGDFAMLFQAMQQGQVVLQNMLRGAGDLYRNLLFLDDLFTFLDLAPTTRDPAVPVPLPTGLTQGITLRDIAFQYPHSPRRALADFSLTLPAGRIVAIVGENGAGKSTLIKLLCRFYDPDQGAITWDGIDIRQVAQTDLRRRISVLFQQPVPYHESVRDNIAIGDIHRSPSLPVIQQAAHGAGAGEFIATLPQAYDTILGKWFGYTQLSVGQWQRLALARAFVRQADLVILDEPTSAMDSWAENEWMHRFRTLVQGRTALLITHRFTTAMQADIIHVMHDGRIVESGTHAELVAQGGRYAHSWQTQMREAASRIHQPA